MESKNTETNTVEEFCSLFEFLADRLGKRIDKFSDRLSRDFSEQLALNEEEEACKRNKKRFKEPGDRISAQLKRVETELEVLGQSLEKKI